MLEFHKCKQNNLPSKAVYLWTAEARDSRCVSSLQLNSITPSQGLAIEFLLTLQLVLCVLAVTDKRRNVGGFAPLAIGLSVGLGHLAGVSAWKHSPSSFICQMGFSVFLWPDTMDVDELGVNQNCV